VSLNIEVPYNQGAGLYLPLTGGALTGPLALGANKITGLANGSAGTDAATFGQVQTTEAALNPALQYNDLLGWTSDIADGSLTFDPIAAGYIYLGRIPLPAPLTVTNIWMVLEILGLTLVNSYVALYNSAGTVIGQSADQSTAWGAGGSTGIKTIPLVGGPYVCAPLAANDFLWAAHYVGTATTAPAFLFANNGAAERSSAGTTTARSRFAVIGQSNTATLPSITPSGLIPAQYPYWHGIS
jgi:hypothetical protein